MRHILLLPLAVLALTCGCGSFSDSVHADAVPVVAVTAARRPGAGGGRPVRIACVQDKTGSAARTRTPQLNRGDLAPLIELLRERGGELAVGVIHGSVRVQMVRLRIDRPPSPPESLPAGTGNPLDEAERESTQAADQVAFEKDVEIWETGVATRLRSFDSDLAALLKIPSDSPTSPVWAALQRADLFLAESDASWPEPPSRYGIILSDGADNTVKAAATLSSGAAWLLVNGDGGVGALGGLNPKRFESVASAFADVIAVERGRRSYGF